MNLNARTLLRAGAVGATTTLVALTTAAPGVATTRGDVTVANTETVQVYASATGEPEQQRVYEQLAFTGNGTVHVSNPVSTDGLRNLDGFGGFDVEGGRQVADVTVSGERRLRTVSDYDHALPLDVSVAYLLDGRAVEPGDVVGESGTLEVRYRVTNTTGEMREVSFDDGTGRQVTKRAEVVIPMVGSLATTLPSTFTDVRSDEANMAGDGRGGTKLSFTMTLFPPIGSDTAEFGYRAKVVDGVVPPATISALPVNPLESPSFSRGADSYAGGADTGAELVSGAQTIDEHLLELRDGAGELLAGLIKLRDGASQLNAGLAGEATPGAQRLADGAETLADGLSLLDDGGLLLATKMGEAHDGSVKLADGAGALGAGLGDLDDGAHRLADGAGAAAKGARRLDHGAGRLAGGLTSAEEKAPSLVDGLTQVKGGLKLVDKGLTTMYAGTGTLPAKAQPLHDGIQQLVAGIGTVGSEGTLLYGVDQMRSTLQNEAVPGLDLLIGGTSCADRVLGDLINGSGPQAPDACYQQGFPGLPGLASSASPLDRGRAQVLQQVRAGLTDPSGVNPDPTMLEGLELLKSKLTSTDVSDPGAIMALSMIECGLDNATLPVCDASNPGLIQGLGAVDQGVTTLVDEVVRSIQGGIGRRSDTAEDQTLRGGINALQDGARRLSAGGDALLEGLTKLSDGADDLSAGTGELSSGLGDLSDGTDALVDGTGRAASGAGDLADGSGQLEEGLGKLSDGAGDLSDGATKAADGSGELSDGAGRLADGLGDAADGSGRLSDGLGKAADGAPRLVDGAQRLSDEGMGQLVDAGKDTAADYGEKYAVIEASAVRAQSEGMAYGAPAGADGATAFTYELAAEDGEGSRNLQRGVGAVVLLAAGAAVAALRRRVV